MGHKRDKMRSKAASWAFVILFAVFTALLALAIGFLLGNLETVGTAVFIAFVCSALFAIFVITLASD